MEKESKKKSHLAIIFLLMLFIAFTVSLLGIRWYIQPTNTVIMTWKQDDSVKYDKDGKVPHYLSVVEDDISISRIPYSTHRRYYIYVGRDSGKPVYGHRIEYSFTKGYDDINTYIKKCSVKWSADGVTFEEFSGHKLFIPKNMYLGGR